MRGSDMPNRTSLEKQEMLKSEVGPFFDYMQKYGMTLTWLARKLGITVQRVSFYRRGENQAPVWVIRQGYEALGSPPELSPFIISFLTKRAEHPSIRQKSAAKKGA
jgi:hypothetical protein